MNNEIQIFSNEQFGTIRTAGTADNPLFCLADLCRVLELQPSAVMRRLDDGVTSNHPIPDNLGRIQQANFVNEDGLYDVILDSRKPEEMEVLRFENKKKEETLKEQKPKVVFADAIVGSKSSCLIGELAKIITQNGYEIGQNRLFAWMRENHYLGTIGEYYNIPCQKYLEQGLFELKKNVHSQNGNMVTTITPKVTGKGQQYFVNKFLNS